MTEQLPSGERGTLRDPADLPRPALWPAPPSGAQPVPVHGRDKGGPQEEVAQRRLPLAWTGIALMLVGVVLLGFAVGAQSWVLAVLGIAVGAVGAGAALKSRIMEAATVGQSVKDD
jgi:hypothetical protein